MRHPRSAATGALAAVASVALVTAVIFGLRELVPVVSTGVVYMLAVLFVSSIFGLWFGLLSALLSARVQLLPHPAHRPLHHRGELIDQLATSAGVAVDSRIGRGRTPRHALSALMDTERYDTLVVTAQTSDSDGFAADDVAWLLENAPGEVLILRPGADSEPAG